jgi:hypothetical protein
LQNLLYTTLKVISSAALGQFLEILSCGLETSEPVLLLPLQGEQESGGRLGNLKLPHQIHMTAAFQAHRDELFVQSMNHGGVWWVSRTNRPQ